MLRRNLWSSLAVLTTGLLSVGPVSTLAQSTSANCLPSFNWMNNSKSQSPCLVAAYLQGACNSGQFVVGALPPDTHYTGPTVDQQNPCQCSSVTYNAVSACGLCQNHTFVSWSVWNTNCSTIYPNVFLPGVPVGTAIPQWAFQDVTSSGGFDVALAQSVGDNPESTATHVQSTGSALASTSTSASAAITSSPTLSSSGSSDSKSNIGAIAGGVIGGVVAVALITGAIVFFIMKKKRSRTPPSAEFNGAPSYPFSSAAYTDTTPFASRITPPKLYDPSDPSTFPASPPPTTVGTGSTHRTQNSHYYSSPLVHPSGYSGMPEI